MNLAISCHYELFEVEYFTHRGESSSLCPISEWIWTVGLPIGKMKNRRRQFVQ